MEELGRTFIDEEWRDIPGFIDYKVSNLGRVKSYKRGAEGLIRKPGVLKTGYHLMCLYRDGVQSLPLLHRLVLLAFVGPSNLDVNHKNGIKGDNRLENLEYCTKSENIRHADRLGLRVAKSGSALPHSKLQESDIPEIRRMLEEGVKHKEIAALFGVGHANISAIKQGISWKHVK